MAGIVLDGQRLTSYVEEHNLPLIHKAVLGAKSIKEMNLQTGVKGDTALNLLATNATFGDGSDCGWNAAGESTISQRVLSPGVIKVNMPFCDKKLLKSWMNYEVKVAAGQKTLPFEEDFTNGVTEDVAQKLEKAIWQGDKSSSDANLNRFDGMVKLIEAATIADTYTILSTDSKMDIVEKLYAKIPSAAFNKGEVVMYMGSDNYRAYVMELVKAGSLVITTSVNDVPMPESVLIPGTNVRVIGLAGLDGVNKYFASYKDNFFYGTDLQNDEEKFELWYSQDNREFRLAIEFTAGVQVAYPDMIVEAK